MPRNSFVQMNKLTNVSGRITYISSKAKQENLYATYTTVPDRSFWRELAKCNQECFRKKGTEGKCIEARELIIALPESFVHYEPAYLLKRFTDHFKQKYKVECISALHHNKRKTNYHIHLIFAERQLLDKPIEKIATRNMFYDEKGKHRRTKKEILDEAGNIRKKCKVIKKGEVYERNLFTTKNELYKADGFLDEVKRLYTDLINVCAINEEDKLHVFDRNGLYLATKKIGKNNPKAAEIEADNMERVRWNQTVDRALISGVAEEDILGVKRENISEEVKRSIELFGNNPTFLAEILRLAIKALELLISKVLLAAAKVAEKIVDVVHEKVVEKEVIVLIEEPEQAIVVQEEMHLPKKPEEPLLLSKYPVIMELDAELKRRNKEIFAVEQERGNLEIQLAECTGVFKQKQRKELQERITLLDKKVEKMKTELSKVLGDVGYANVAEFFTELFAVREEKRQYEEACKVWQEECVKAEISISSKAYYTEETARRSEKRLR
ncbi:MAG: MobA/MobL family protein [Bacteroidales bacterium]|nr:MobA/MobL family protein [Bacteroidales bacterium]